ncbi:hypothetical protein ABKN59_011602 [Abortiporus biennis]
MSRRLSPLFIALFLQALQVIQVTARFLLNFPVDLNLSSNILNPHPGTETWPIITPSPVFSPHRLRLTPIPSSIHLFTDAFDCDVDSYNFGDFRICPDEIWLIIDSTGYDNNNNSSNHAKTFTINVSSELDFSGLMDLSIQMFSSPQIPSKALLKTKTKTKTKANSQTPAAMVKSNINDHPNHDDSTSNLNFLQNSKQIPLKSTSTSTSSKDRYQLVPNRDQQQQHKVTTSTSSSSESVHHRQYARIRLVENPDIIGNGKRIARRHMVVPFEISLIEVERDS